jgi:hypothetical protein
MVDVDDTVELIIPGVGEGVGDGDGVGIGVGVGVGVGVAVAVAVGVGDCACAAEIAPIVSTSAIAIRRAHARPAPTLRVREARDEQRINFIPDKSARSQNSPKNRSAGQDLRPDRTERQSVTGLTRD